MPHPILRKNSLVIAGLVAVAGVLVWLFPLFHVVPLKGIQEQQRAAEFDAAAAAAQFWEAKLLPATARAVEVKDLLSALAADANVAPLSQDGAVGSGTFLVKGKGRVTSVEEEAVVVAVDGTTAKVKLFTGLLFGNTVRDATGLLDVSAYANSQDFNDLSTQLNKLVETRISPELRRQATVGRTIRFVGCAELEAGTNADGLSIVPVRVEWS